MHAKSPSSILVSLTIHAFIAAIIFVSTVYVVQQEKPPVIFELVAGPGTAPDELVAPAAGNSATPVKIEVPKVEAPPPETAPANEPEVSTKATPVKPPPTKAATDMSITKEMKRSAKVAYQEHLRLHPLPKPSTTPTTQKTAANVPRIDTQGIAGGVRGGSTANTRGGGNGKALTREEQNEFNTYISFLRSALREAYEPPPGVSDQMEARVTFEITASGSILNPRISKSSGDRAFDEAVIEAFRRLKSIGPTPDGKSDTWNLIFHQKDAS